MRKASIRDLHIRTSELVREAAEGETIVIERRGEPVAELRPLTPRPAPSREYLERACREMKEFWKGKPSNTDVTLWISEDRDR